MYISRRVDIIGPPVWKSIIAPCLSKSELASLRPWQSERQRHMLSPLHRHMLTLPSHPTAPSCTRNPSDIERDTDIVLCLLYLDTIPHFDTFFLTKTDYLSSDIP